MAVIEGLEGAEGRGRWCLHFRHRTERTVAPTTSARVVNSCLRSQLLYGPSDRPTSKPARPPATTDCAPAFPLAEVPVLCPSDRPKRQLLKDETQITRVSIRAIVADASNPFLLTSSMDTMGAHGRLLPLSFL